MITNPRKRNRGIGKKRCPTALGELAKKLGVPKNRLYVLAPANDPFNAGTALDRELAKWFAEIWEKHGFGRGVHLRHIHYRLVSLPNGDVLVIPGRGRYINTDECRKELQKAAKKARHLGLVDAADFEDRRNPPPKLYAPELNRPDDPEWHIDDFERIRIRLSALLSHNILKLAGKTFQYDVLASARRKKGYRKGWQGAK